MARRERAGFLLALVLGGCTVGPRYTPPKATLPPSYPASAAGEPIDDWWSVFQDPELTSLVTRALQDNRDLKVALSRVRQARFEREVAAGALLPEVDATAGYNRSRGSKHVTLPFGNGGAPPAAGAAPAAPRAANVFHPDQAGASPAEGQATSGGGQVASAGGQPGGPASPFGEGGLPGVTTNLFQAGFDAVYEIDLFGGTRRAIEAADAAAAAAVEGEHGVRLSLVAEVATTYFQLRAGQEREAIARRNLAAQREVWKNAEDKFKAGLGGEADAAQAAAQARTTEAMLPPIVEAETAARHALGFLVAVDPEALDAELSARGPSAEASAKAETARSTSVPLPPAVPLGVPSDLLRRRPDIRQAERQLQAAYAEVGVATAQLFPQFSLTGSLGLDSSTIKHLFETGSNYYSVAPGIRWPILDWTRLHAQIRVESELEAQALLGYQTAVAQALKDVEDALVQYETEKTRQAALAQAVAESRRAERIARQTYSQGLADQLLELDAERALLQAEDSLAQSDAALRTDLVGLFKALGGGWQDERAAK